MGVNRAELSHQPPKDFSKRAGWSESTNVSEVGQPGQRGQRGQRGPLMGNKRYGFSSYCPPPPHPPPEAPVLQRRLFAL